MLAVDVTNGGQLRVGVEHVDGEHGAVDTIYPRGPEDICSQQLCTSACWLLQLDMVHKDAVECIGQSFVVEAVIAILEVEASLAHDLVVEITSQEADPLVLVERGLLDAPVELHLVAMASCRVNMHNNELQ